MKKYLFGTKYIKLFMYDENCKGIFFTPYADFLDFLPTHIGIHSTLSSFELFAAKAERAGFNIRTWVKAQGKNHS